MIEERMQEQASLYVLGALTTEELRAFQTALVGDPELQKFVESLGGIAEAFAGTIPAVMPPASLKKQILAQINELPGVVPMPAMARPKVIKTEFAWIPWALAACLAVLCLVLAVHENNLQTRYDALKNMAAGFKTESDGLKRIVAELQDSTNSLQKTVLALQENNKLANTRIAMLGSLLSDQPKAVAVSVWDEKNQNGVFVVENLKPLPKDKDYQLWVIDPQYKTPVDAGIFKVDADGKVRFEFKPKQAIGVADKFAVTAEASGGSPTPKGTMVLIGG